MAHKLFLSIGITLCTAALWAQDAFVFDTLLLRDIDEVIVTATRNERHLGHVAVPTLLVSAKAIQLSGNLRLNEVLQEQTGLFLTAGAGSSAVGGGVFGNGIQIQGLSPDHTLIMLDGEPLIGRQGGVIDLSRFTVGNIRKIEVVKGPSSALYGSEAMGGVVNILTEQRRGNRFTAGARYGSFRTSDVYASANLDSEQSTLYVFGNYNASQGYDLQPATPERTVDPYHNATLQVKWTRRFTDQTRLVWNNRIFRGVQQSEFAIGGPIINVTGMGETTDINVNPTLHHRFHDRLKTAIRLYGSMYRYEQQLDRTDDNGNGGTSYYKDDFQHIFLRLENQTDWDWAPGQQLVAGGGYNIQTVETMRYRTTQTQHIGYGFIQNEWRPNTHWIITPGLRYDIHSDYANRLTPKLSAQYKASPSLRVNFSYGSGFKAPDFRQLYLYYINPAGQGYRIYGASEFSLTELEQQQADGIVARILPEAYKITELRPEISHGFNLGLNYAPPKTTLKADVNLFYNNVQDLINYLPVAVMSNNSLVFSYLNVNEAFTAGVEANVQGRIRKAFEWSAGYQYLRTGDRRIVEGIRNNEVFGRDTPLGTTRRMARSDYGGLLGRSPHLLNAKILYDDPDSGWGGSLRAIYRSRWGVMDLDGNGFANMSEEFAQGFTMLNLSAQRTFAEVVTVQLNINNLLNHIDAVNAPQMPGTHVMLAVHWAP